MKKISKSILVMCLAMLITTVGCGGGGSSGQSPEKTLDRMQTIYTELEEYGVDLMVSGNLPQDLTKADLRKVVSLANEFVENGKYVLKNNSDSLDLDADALKDAMKNAKAVSAAANARLGKTVKPKPEDNEDEDSEDSEVTSEWDIDNEQF